MRQCHGTPFRVPSRNLHLSSEMRKGRKSHQREPVIMDSERGWTRRAPAPTSPPADANAIANLLPTRLSGGPGVPGPAARRRTPRRSPMQARDAPWNRSFFPSACNGRALQWPSRPDRPDTDREGWRTVTTESNASGASAERPSVGCEQLETRGRLPRGLRIERRPGPGRRDVTARGQLSVFSLTWALIGRDVR